MMLEAHSASNLPLTQRGSPSQSCQPRAPTCRTSGQGDPPPVGECLPVVFIIPLWPPHGS